MMQWIAVNDGLTSLSCWFFWSSSSLTWWVNLANAIAPERFARRSSRSFSSWRVSLVWGCEDMLWRFFHSSPLRKVVHRIMMGKVGWLNDRQGWTEMITTEIDEQQWFLYRLFIIISGSLACLLAYSVQLPSYTLFFDGNSLASNARKSILAVTPPINFKTWGLPVPQEVIVSFE